jgi:hypothetical protein
MEQSKFLSLNWGDVLKGLLMAVLTPVAGVIEQTVEKGSLVFNWHLIGVLAVGGFVGYIIKNFLTPSSSTSDSPVAK